MKSVMVMYDEASDTISGHDSSESEFWADVCEKYNDDVHRTRSVADMGTYTGLYECIDDDNKSFYYIVEEDPELYKFKRRGFYKKLGIND